MCGILGHLAFNHKHRISESFIKSLNQYLLHRGPDSEGTYHKGDISLAMRRLSIIDLDGGDQPIYSTNGRYVIIFNGEIYNYQEIKINLQRKGYRFKTKSDTEVLLYSFIDKGPECLKTLNGMFAFAIWDGKKQELFLARDRLGIKPLYYSLNHERVMFSSEITPIYKSNLFDLKINFNSISDYLAYWYICEPKTIFRGVYQLSPGTYSIIKNGKSLEKKYWEIPCRAENNILYADALEQLEFLLNDSIKLRMKVDVPIGTFLSGGIDSGLITGIASKYKNEQLRSFSINFTEKTYSELAEAEDTARRNGVNLTNFEIGTLTPDLLDEIFLSFDEPLGNASFVPTYILAKKAREKVKVVLTGDGGDELFGGYPTYQALYYQKLFSIIPNFLRNILRSGSKMIPVSHNRISFDFRIKQLMKGIHLTYQRAHYTWREVTPLNIQNELFKNEIWQNISSYDPFSVSESFFTKAQNLGIQNQLMFVDMNTYLLNDHLRKVDRMTMAHGLEARVPFLDHRIIELVQGFPSKYKVNFFKTKKILKQVAKPYLSKTIINGSKKGLTSPIASWISKDLYNYVNDQLKGGIVEDLFDKNRIQLILKQHYNKEYDNSRIIWSLLSIQVWSRKISL